MAIQNKDGIYLKIMNVMLPNNIVVERYRNHDIRLNGPGEFDKVIPDGIYSADLETEVEEMADSKLSIRNNLITAGYRALKKKAEFKDWTDV